MCICINCLYVHKCSTYQFVTIQHNENKHYSSMTTIFHPIDPILNANFKEINMSMEVDWDVIECLSFLEKPGNWQAINLLL
uniref:Uncharacterized protein n=1 Tax=Helminthora furcellata TaxID=1884666 RepID=A0A1G4NR21_9FLOR|nr:Hypothetical protein ycf34 [Helminthora furcellata]SCW21113.1 Hypothetical protein ycf34 [Helminthora furcellata]SCW23973.1 Hypothetical protein ycf34 [Helminthora furcellata]